jgi:hypothetical protein
MKKRIITPKMDSKDMKLENLLHTIPRHTLPYHVHANIMQSLAKGSMIDSALAGSTSFVTKTLATAAVLACVVLGSFSVSALYNSDKDAVTTASDLPLLDECSLLEMM